jgi:tetratricopeptide (TPR) repeat protein
MLMFLGKALVEDQQVARASEVLDTLAKRVLPSNPRDRSAQLVVAGEIALAQGRADSAVKLFRVAYTIDSSAYIAESLARGLAAAGDLAGAAQRYTALAAGRDSWFGHEAEQYGLRAPRDAGRVYEQLGDTARARMSYERVLAQWPGGDPDLVTIRDAQDRLKALLRASPGLSPRGEGTAGTQAGRRRSP